MAEITEIFILKMKDPDRAAPVRERARADYLGLDGVASWRTFVTIHPDKPTLFAEIYTFPDEQTARRVTPEFAKRPATRAFLDEIDEILVGQYFVELPSAATKQRHIGCEAQARPGGDDPSAARTKVHEQAPQPTTPHRARDRNRDDAISHGDQS